VIAIDAPRAPLAIAMCSRVAVAGGCFASSRHSEASSRFDARRYVRRRAIWQVRCGARLLIGGAATPDAGGLGNETPARDIGSVGETKAPPPAGMLAVVGLAIVHRP
jgi:hypothetical protein